MVLFGRDVMMMVSLWFECEWLVDDSVVWMFGLCVFIEFLFVVYEVFMWVC